RGLPYRKDGAMSEGYWRITAIAIVTCLQLASGTVQAAEKSYTAKDHLQDCKDSLLERAAFPRPFNSGLCMGLVAGVNYVDAKSCAPEDASNSQLILLSQKVAADREENHLFGKIHTSAVGSLEWIYRDQAMATRGFRPMWRGSRA